MRRVSPWRGLGLFWNFVFLGGLSVSSSVIYLRVGLQTVFITYQLWWVNSEFLDFHTVSLYLFSSAILLCSPNPTMSCWTTSTHFLLRWEARAHSSHLQLLDDYISHLFSISCRMEWWCLALHIVTRRNTWLLCCTSQYEHHSSSWPVVLGQCSLRTSSLNQTYSCSVL